LTFFHFWLVVILRLFWCENLRKINCLFLVYTFSDCLLRIPIECDIGARESVWNNFLFLWLSCSLQYEASGGVWHTISRMRVPSLQNLQEKLRTVEILA
jgi:hypothetical protein